MGRDLQITDRAGPVLIQRDVERALRGGTGGSAGARPPPRAAARPPGCPRRPGRPQHGLPVCRRPLRHSRPRPGLSRRGAHPPSNTVSASAGPSRPEPRRPREPVLQPRAWNPPVASEVTAGKNAADATPICALAEATRRSAAAMSGRRSSMRDGRSGGIAAGRPSSGIDGRKVRRRLANEHRDRVFELIALQAHVGRLRLRRGELRIRLLDVGARDDTGVVLIARQRRRPLVRRRSSGRTAPARRRRSATGSSRPRAPPLRLSRVLSRSRHGRLRRRCAGGDSLADTAPEIGFPGGAPQFRAVLGRAWLLADIRTGGAARSVRAADRSRQSSRESTRHGPVARAPAPAGNAASASSMAGLAVSRLLSRGRSVVRREDCPTKPAAAALVGWSCGLQLRS